MIISGHQCVFSSFTELLQEHAARKELHYNFYHYTCRVILARARTARISRPIPPATEVQKTPKLSNWSGKTMI
jgi:hypothetical protein